MTTQSQLDPQDGQQATISDSQDAAGQTAHSLHPDDLSRSGSPHRHAKGHKTAKEHASEMHRATGLQVTSSTAPDDGKTSRDHSPSGSFPQSAQEGMVVGPSTSPYVNQGIYNY